MKIKKLREAAGIKQSVLAAHLGIDRSTVAKWESGEAMPRAGLLPKLAKILGCRIDELYAQETEGGV